MMKNLLIIGGVLLGVIGLLAFDAQKSSAKKRIGIVVPIEHQAMEDMTAGFIETIQNKYGSEVSVTIQNAHGDRNIQEAIIENYRRTGYDIIVPIGTDVTLMTQNCVREIPILGLDVTSSITQEQHNVTGVRESPIEPSYQFIKALMPTLQKVTMVYSGSDKDYAMVEVFQQAASADGVDVQPLMIQSLADLYVLAQAVDADSDALFIAKDHLVASGAPSLVQTANQLGIPFITSDEGTVLSGAGVALGNKEVEIGRAGGEIAIQLLEGARPHDIPIRPLNAFTVFVNRDALAKQGLTIEGVQRVADTLGYPVEVFEREFSS